MQGFNEVGSSPLLRYLHSVKSPQKLTSNQFSRCWSLIRRRGQTNQLTLLLYSEERRKPAVVQLEAETKVLIIILLTAFSELRCVTGTQFLGAVPCIAPLVHITTPRYCRLWPPLLQMRTLGRWKAELTCQGPQPGGGESQHSARPSASRVPALGHHAGANWEDFAKISVSSFLLNLNDLKRERERRFKVKPTKHWELTDEIKEKEHTKRFRLPRNSLHGFRDHAAPSPNQKYLWSFDSS